MVRGRGRHLRRRRGAVGGRAPAPHPGRDHPGRPGLDGQGGLQAVVEAVAARHRVRVPVRRATRPVARRSRRSCPTSRRRSCPSTRRSSGTARSKGVAGPEASNNASAAGTLVPMLALGLPVSATAAVMLAAFQTYGIQPGPLLFDREPELVWGLIASLFIGNALLLVLNLPLAPFWAKLLSIPRPYLYAGILFFASLGAYAVNAQPFDLVLLLVLGALGFAMRRYGLPGPPGDHRRDPRPARRAAGTSRAADLRWRDQRPVQHPARDRHLLPDRADPDLAADQPLRHPPDSAAPRPRRPPRPHPRPGRTRRGTGRRRRRPRRDESVLARAERETAARHPRDHQWAPGRRRYRQTIVGVPPTSHRTTLDGSKRDGDRDVRADRVGTAAQAPFPADRGGMAVPAGAADPGRGGAGAGTRRADVGVPGVGTGGDADRGVDGAGDRGARRPLRARNRRVPERDVRQRPGADHRVVRTGGRAARGGQGVDRRIDPGQHPARARSVDARRRSAPGSAELRAPGGVGAGAAAVARDGGAGHAGDLRAGARTRPAEPARRSRRLPRRCAGAVGRRGDRAAAVLRGRAGVLAQDPRAPVQPRARRGRPRRGAVDGAAQRGHAGDRRARRSG